MNTEPRLHPRIGTPVPPRTAAPHAAIRTALALVVAVGLAACDSSSTGLEEDAAPPVSGVWTGDFRGSTMRLSLTQSGSNVAGTLMLGVRDYALTGTVDASGSFQWSTAVREADCSRLASSEMQLQDEASTLVGRMVRSSEAPPCDGGRTLVESDLVELTKAF